ncbi:MAG: FG-GAP repeat protein, partial [Vicinamibacterales bacterium]|nr:FG-GAP repeat protein [Vicinamibacterales bacterium]
MLALVAAAAVMAQPSPTAAQSIVQQAQLLPAGAAGDRVGSSLAVDGTTLVVGAPYDDVGANSNQGSAY